MRLFTPIVAIALALSFVASADAQQRRQRRTPGEDNVEGYYRRPSTVDRRGLCQRDNGRPFHSLNLNQQCDREEFWSRMNERGNDRN